MLRKLECFLIPSRLDKMREMLLKMGINGMSVIQAQGFGTRSKVKNGIPQFEERVKVELVVNEEQVDVVLAGIKELANEGSVGGGMIFIHPVEDAIRIATLESGKAAIR